MTERTRAMSDPSYHDAEIAQDFDGWTIVECSCGWVSPPCPGTGEAMGFYGDHRASDE